MQLQSLCLDLDLCCPAQPFSEPLQPRTATPQPPACPSLEHSTPHLSTFTHIGRRSHNLDTIDYITTDEYQLLGIYDGHGDAAVSNYLKQALLKKLQRHPKLHSEFKQAVGEVFREIDEEVSERVDKSESSGSTALVVLVAGDKVTAVNLGDSRAVLVTAEGGCVQINEEHTLSNPKEYEAVTAKGGLVLKRGDCYRINGQLNVSRSFGDHKLKPFLSTTPQIRTFAKSSSKFLIMGTDGFWQNTTNKRVALQAHSHNTAQHLARKLFNTCCPKPSDNASIICVLL